MRHMDNTIGLKRKCGCCGEYLYITKNNIDNVIYYDKKTYHSRCFTNLCQDRICNGRSNVSKRWEQIYKNLETIKKDTYSHYELMIECDDIFNFIKDFYGLTVVSSTIWTKLDSIYNGTFKGMSIGIPPSDLLDMWKRKADMLNNIAKQNETKGTYLQPENRVIYDLSILVNKYDSYLRWKEKQKILEVEKETIITQNIVGQSIGYSNVQKNNPKETDDITDLVDDIFG